MAKDKTKSCALSDGKDAPIPHKLTELFWTLGPAFTRWAESHMHEQGLTPQRVRLLGLLYENGPLMMSGLRDELGVTATNVTALVDALEKDSMVTRKPHPTDRRATIIALTAKAEKSMLKNCAAFKDKVSELFSGFSKSDQEQFFHFLLRTREGLVKRGILEESDLCPQLRKKPS